MELDELEKNNRKRLAEATVQEFESLDAVSKSSQFHGCDLSLFSSYGWVVFWLFNFTNLLALLL